MRKLELVVEVFLSCLGFIGMLAGMFLAFLFLSEILLKVLESTGAQRIPEIGELFVGLFSFMVVSGGILIFGFALSNRFGPDIDAYGEEFKFYSAAFFLLWLLSLFTAILGVTGTINFEDLINNFVKNLPSSHFEAEELSRHYGRMVEGWPFWLGIGLLPFLFMLFHFTEEKNN